MSGKPTKVLRKALGANVRTERHRRALTQESLAEQLGITPRYLAAIERGERNLTLDSIEALAEQLNIDPHSLLVRP